MQFLYRFMKCFMYHGLIYWKQEQEMYMVDGWVKGVTRNLP